MSGWPRGRGLLLAAVVAVVLAVVGVAVAVLDSPAEERRRRLDERRVDDLQTIAEAMDAYWTERGELPPDLDALAAWRGFDLPRTDPVSETPYRYRFTGGHRYQLCATFATEASTSVHRRASYLHGTYWHHPAGDHCFGLEADEVER